MQLLLVFLLGFGVQEALAQQPQGSVEGRVVDSRMQAPLSNVNIFIEGTVWGKVSDSLGYFHLGPLPAGHYQLSAKMIGFQAHQESIQVVAGQTLAVEVSLQPAVLIGEEVTVEQPRRPVEPWQTVTPSSFHLQVQQLETVPGSHSDVLRVLQTLPGVLAVSDFSNQLIVRGGNPNQNLILLDGIELFNPYKSNGMMSVINSAILRDVSLYTGGFPALFGDRLSSVLTATVREGAPDQRLAGKFGVGLSGANLILEGKTGFMDGSWLVSARRTFFELYVESLARNLGIFNEVSYPRFEDVQAKVVFKPWQGHRLQFLGLYNRDGTEKRARETLGEQGSEELSGMEGSTENLLLGGVWIYSPSTRFQGRIYANGYHTWGQSGFHGVLEPRDEYRPPRRIGLPDPGHSPLFDSGEDLVFDYDQRIDFKRFALGTRWIFQSKRHSLEVGAEVDNLTSSLVSDLELNEFGESVFDAFKTAPNWLGVLADSINRGSSYHRWHGYIQDKWALLNERLFIQPSLRYDYYDIVGRGYLSPRFNFSLLLNARTTLQGAWGRYLQSPGYEKLYDAGDPLDLSRYKNLNGLSAEEATHFVVGLSRDLGAGWYLNADWYWKSLSNLIVQQTVDTTRLVAKYRGGGGGTAELAVYRLEEEAVIERVPIPVNGARGRSYGLDLLLEKRAREPSDRWYGWLSYAYGNNLWEQTIGGNLIEYPSDYDRRHAVNLVLNHRFGRRRNWNLGLMWSLGSGLPYTPATSVEPLIMIVTNDSIPGGEIANVILTDPETGYIRFIPTFGDPDNVNSGRLPGYQRLDIRFSYQVNWFRSTWEFYLDLVNIFNRKNTLYYRNIIVIEEDTREHVPLALRFSPRWVLYRQPVYMYPFIPSLGFAVSF